MKIITRSANDTLYAMMKSCFTGDHEFQQVKSYDGWIEAYTFLLDTLSKDQGMIVIMDEDCFVTDEKAIDGIIEYMHARKYHVAGVPDGGVIPHRQNSWSNVNPFFMIVDTSVIAPMLSQRNHIQLATYFPEIFYNKPDFVTAPFDHNYFEPFAGLLYWLYDNFNVLFLNARQHEDGISTIIIDRDEYPFAVHTWYSREYNVDEFHTRRINSIYSGHINHNTVP